MALDGPRGVTGPGPGPHLTRGPHQPFIKVVIYKYVFYFPFIILNLIWFEWWNNLFYSFLVIPHGLSFAKSLLVCLILQHCIVLWDSILLGIFICEKRLGETNLRTNKNIFYPTSGPAENRPSLHPAARGALKKLGQKLKRGPQIEPCRLCYSWNGSLLLTEIHFRS